MSYYPKSQIKLNLYTNGDEYIVFTTKTKYKGSYYETSSGKKYAGTSPNSPNTFLLIPFDSNIDSIHNISNFNLTTNPKETLITLLNDVPYINEELNIKFNQPTNLTEYIDTKGITYRNIPQYYTPFPTPQETQQGSIIRYFCKKGNEYRYIEINKETYNKLFSQDKTVAWDLYTPISLQWSTVSNTSSPPTSYFENQLGWVGFSRYVKPLKTPTTIQPK